jgi:hypothetical protein
MHNSFLYIYPFFFSSFFSVYFLAAGLAAAGAAALAAAGAAALAGAAAGLALAAAGALAAFSGTTLCFLAKRRFLRNLGSIYSKRKPTQLVKAPPKKKKKSQPSEPYSASATPADDSHQPRQENKIKYNKTLTLLRAV